MSSKSKRIATLISLFLVFAVSQVYIGASFAGPGPAAARSESPTVTPQQPTGILTTKGNKAITVNGATAISGATIVSGADIETPDAVGATVSLGSLGSLQIQPNTKLTLEFQSGSVKVMVVRGCVTLRTKKGTAGEVDTPRGVVERTDPAKDGMVKVLADQCTSQPRCTCFGVAGATAAVPEGPGLLGLGTIASIAVIGGFVAEVVLPMIFRGRNPSPFR